MDGDQAELIYITGGTGFIGSRVAKQLLGRGDRVRCLVRSRERAAELVNLGAETIEGDIADQRTHERGLEGASGAIHLAAIYDIGIVDAAQMQRTNVEGTRAFLNAVRAAGTARAVHVSSTAALGPVPEGLSEPRDAYPGPYHSVYHRTKAESHMLARQAQESGLPLVLVCPAFVYGPGDEGPVGRFVADLLKRKVPALLSGPAYFSYVYVDDAAAGIVAALDRGTLGEVYILSGENTHMNDFAERIATLGKVRAPRLRLPMFLARLSGAVLDPVSRLTGLRFPITLEAVKTTSVDRWLHAHERASRDLGYQPRPLSKGLQETLR